MKPAAVLAAYAVVLVAVFGLGAGIGALVGPVDVEPAVHQEQHTSEENSE